MSIDIANQVKRMIYDQLDFFIMVEFYKAALEKKETTTWKIAKSFPWADSSKNFSKIQTMEFLTKKMNLIKSRIKSMSDEGLVKVETNEKDNKIFNLLGDKVIFCKHRFPNGYKDSLQIKGKDNKWSIFQL